MRNMMTIIETTAPKPMLCINDYSPLEISKEIYGYCFVGFDLFSKAATGILGKVMDVSISLHLNKMVKDMLANSKKSLLIVGLPLLQTHLRDGVKIKE
jgi:hypothetical protein